MSPNFQLLEVSDDTYREIADGVALPIEQAPVWDRFDAVVAGREPWHRLALYEDDAPRAVINLTMQRGPGLLRYLWAKNGPVWLAPPSPVQEAAMHSCLRTVGRKAVRGAVFLRLHAWHDAPHLQPVLQGITYDRTVVVDLAKGEDAVFAGMKQQGRRAIRKALKDDTLTCEEETAQDPTRFAELYDVFVETGRREGFGPHPAQRYLDMLSTLGPQHARIFVTRREGRALAWALVLVNDGAGLYSVGASNAEARGAHAADLLHWRIMQTLAGEGIASYDLAGAGSDRFPGLHGLTQFKTKFEREISEVAPAWDLALRPTIYRGLVFALRAKRWIGDRRAALRER